MTPATGTDYQHQTVTPRAPALRRWLFLAIFLALLVAGFVQILALFADDTPRPPLRMRGSQLIASGTLSTALHQPDAAPLERAPTVGPRTRNADGRECRSFAGRPAVEGSITGTACLIDNAWHVVDLRQDVAAPKLR